MIGGGTRKIALAAALLISGACPAAPADLPVPRLLISCSVIRAQLSLLPPNWTEAMVRQFARQLGYSDRDFDAAKRCVPSGKR